MYWRCGSLDVTLVRALLLSCVSIHFLTVYSDVGGGATEDSEESALSDITLRWMVREIAASQCGISFDTMALQRNNIPTKTFQSVFRVLPPCDSPMLECADHSHSKQTYVGQTEVEPCVEPAVPPAHVQAGGECKGVPNAIVKGCSAKCRERARTLDQADCVDPIHDELKLSPMWWLLEMLPMPYSWQDADGVWQKKWRLVPLPSSPFFWID